MKYGFRTPNLKKSFSARTSGRFTRSYKRAFNPYYGRRGIGYLHNPKRAAYNYAYHRTSRPIYPESNDSGFGVLGWTIVIIIGIIILSVF